MKRLSTLREIGLDALTICVLFFVLLPILWVFVASTVFRVFTLLLLRRVPMTTVDSAAVPMRPMTIRSSGESLDSPILSGLPDHTHE